MSRDSHISRRSFFKTSAALGGGLLIGFYLPHRGRPASAATPATTPFAPNAFLRIGADDRITVLVNHSEMGQGVYTSLPMLVAEELDADWSKVGVAPAPVDPAYNHAAFGIQMTGGSTSVHFEWERLRQAGAGARVMLVAASARHLADRCSQVSRRERLCYGRGLAAPAVVWPTGRRSRAVEAAIHGRVEGAQGFQAHRQADAEARYT